MNIYLSGAHRTGKTTVAERLAEKINHSYIATKLSTMDMWAHVGSPSAYYTYAERIELQDALFTFLDNVISDTAKFLSRATSFKSLAKKVLPEP